MKVITVLLTLLATATTSWAGSISGKVHWRGVADYSHAVIYAEKVPRESVLPPNAPAVMDQVNLIFVPHVLPVVAGTTVSFPNSDEVRHNVFSPSLARRFNLGTYPRGTTRQIVFDKPGVVALLCNVHAEMSAYVLVLETPHFTVTPEDGTYTLHDLPPGRYTVTVWHERFQAVSRPVEIQGTETIPLNLELTQR